MAKRFKIRDLELEYPNLESKMLELLTTHESIIGAARELGVSDQTVANWLQANGYQRRVIFTKEGQTEPAPLVIIQSKKGNDYARIAISGNNVILGVGSVSDNRLKINAANSLNGADQYHDGIGWNLKNLMILLDN